MAKPSKVSHKHKPLIERSLPIERIVGLFYERFDQPYVNPLAELSLDDFKIAFPDVQEDVLREALAYWTSHSGKKVLQTKVITVKDETVWFVHGLEESPVMEHRSPLALNSLE